MGVHIGLGHSGSNAVAPASLEGAAPALLVLAPAAFAGAGVATNALSIPESDIFYLASLQKG